MYLGLLENELGIFWRMCCRLLENVLRIIGECIEEYRRMG